MSHNMTKEEFIAKLHPNCAQAIEIVDFSGSSKPLTAMIKATGEIMTWTKANQLFRNHSGQFRKNAHGREVFNTLSKEEFQKRLDSKYGAGLISIIEFSSLTAPCTIQCNRCGEIRTWAQGSQMKDIDNPCPKCDKSRKTLEDMQQEIDDIFGLGEFEIIDYQQANKPMKLKHKCGFICVKRDGVKARNMLGCPQCTKAKSKGEKTIANFLLNHNIPFETEFGFKDLRGKKFPLRYDFAIKTETTILLIEFDGEGHYLPNSKYYQGNENDLRKDEYAQEHNYPLLRIPYWEYKHINDLIINFLRLNDYPFGE